MYKTAEVARAVGVSAPTLASWIDRRLIDLGPSLGTGRPRSFSPDDVYRISIVSELVRLGVSVSESAKAASAFSDDAHGDRDASTLFPSGKTILILDESGARCANITDRSAFESAMQTVYADTRTVIAVNVSEIVDRVDAALASGSHKVMPPAAAVFRHGRQLHT